MSVEDLPLFNGPHLPAVRYRNALEELDLRAATNDAPETWRQAVSGMADLIDVHGDAARIPLTALRSCRRAKWPPEIERAWQRLMARRLDAATGTRRQREPAAAWFLRTGERDLARASLHRHLAYAPRDATAWQLLAEFEPIRGAVRCAFHGGVVLETLVGPLLDAVDEDEIGAPGAWLLSYAWFAGAIGLSEIRAALAAEHPLYEAPLPVPGEARAFAWYLLDAGGRSLLPSSVGVVEARQRLKAICAPAFHRYLERIDQKGSG